MSYERKEIAIYGKGGIGKSTVCANLSVALAQAGQRVLQIGCDPKHDSTRLLTGGKSLPTVLDYLKAVPAERTRAEDVLGTGTLGIGCIEAGGPKPGVGCAGRGIISAFEYLEKERVKERYDVVLYDVLGDVVCGGFAVPIRREYANVIFLVTSGEFMAIYAANNILRGIRNFDGEDGRRVAGILFNARGLPEEEERVSRFARAVGLPVCAKIPKSEAFPEAEARGCTVMETDEYPSVRQIFTELAGRIAGGLPLYTACPLTDERLEACVLKGRDPGQMMTNAPGDAGSGTEGLPEKPAAAPETDRPAYRPPLYGCAFNGAATTAVHLTDARVIAHSPRSCAFYTWQNISSPGRRNLFHRGILMPSALSPNFTCTEMGHTEAVFGGTEKLRSAVEEALAGRPGAVVVVTSCVSGIIGDDAAGMEDLSTPETPVIVLKTDGDVSGDYMAGIEMCLHGLAERLVDREADVRPLSVNLIGETGVANDLDVNYGIIRDLLEQMGISVNCRFLGGATTAEVRGLLAAPLNVLASDSEDNRRLKEWLEQTYGCSFFGKCLPVGFRETKEFLEAVGDRFGCREKTEPVILREQRRYEAEIEELRPRLKGKRILMTTINANMDWLMDAAEDAGMEFVWVGVLNYLGTELCVTSRPDRCPIEEIGGRVPAEREIAERKPDIVLSNYTSSIPSDSAVTDAIPMGRQIGFRSGIPVLRRWARLLEERREGEWVRDRALFEKYYA
ncbi:MAG: AAA family ATPase [Oscillospiraceae bacterium]|nr:AAA family ATPase [Oscillospiraceae bacterium]